MLEERGDEESKTKDNKSEKNVRSSYFKILEAYSNSNIIDLPPDEPKLVKCMRVFSLRFLLL